MVTKFKTRAFSFVQGEDRSVERQLSDLYAQNAFKPIPSKNNAWYDSMSLIGSAEIVLATALTLVGIQGLTRPFPYGLNVPINMQRLFTNPQVDSADAFFAEVIKAWFGIGAIKDPQVMDDAVWVVVDPHYFNIDTQQQLAKFLHRKPVLMILPEGERVPKALLDTVQDDNEAFPSGILAPFANPMAEEALLRHRHRQIVVVGAGPRLLPTIIGVSDTVLQNVPHPDKLDNDWRRSVLADWVSYCPYGPQFNPWCQFDGRWFTGQSLLSEALAQYLEFYGFNVADHQNSQWNDWDNKSDISILPFWQTS